MATTRLNIASEKVAYWYFRLNGFLTDVNFIIHSETGGGQRTVTVGWVKRSVTHHFNRVLVGFAPI